MCVILLQRLFMRITDIELVISFSYCFVQESGLILCLVTINLDLYNAI